MPMEIVPAQELSKLLVAAAQELAEQIQEIDPEEEEQDGAPGEEESASEETATPEDEEPPDEEEMVAAPIADTAKLYPEYFQEVVNGPPLQVREVLVLGIQSETDRWGREYVGRVHLPRVWPEKSPGQPPVKILFCNEKVHADETRVKQGLPPRLLQSTAGNMFLRALKKAGYEDADWAYSTFHKHVPPTDKAPKAAALKRWSLPAAQADLDELQPQVVVGMGRSVFQWLFGSYVDTSEIRGMLMQPPDRPFLVYYLDELNSVLTKPERYEQMIQDLTHLRQELERGTSRETEDSQVEVRPVTTQAKLREWVAQWVKAGVKTLSVDCEWKGRNFIDGKLRSLQIAWSKKDAVFLSFFQCTYPKELGGAPLLVDSPDFTPLDAGNILRPFIQEQDVKFIGHNAVADLVWLVTHLKLDVYGRVEFDTMFAQHTLNEYADLKLERMACRYTNLGRYDMKLWRWKKQHPVDEDDGYGLVPENIIQPYGVLDVIAVWRIRPHLQKQLEAQGPKLLEYWQTQLLPFVTDGFLEMMLCGLPIDVAHLEQMRDKYLAMGQRLQVKFRNDMFAESVRLLAQKFHQLCPGHVSQWRDWETEMLLQQQSWLESDTMQALSGEEQKQAKATIKWSESDEAVSRIQEEIRELLGPQWVALLPFWKHWLGVWHFNGNSTLQMRRWLYEVKELIPLKSTKKDGIVMSWSRVLEVPLERRGLYAPSTDKNSLKTFAVKDDLITHYLQLKMVQTMTKTFLRPDNKETGKKEGVHAWITQKTHRIHANFSLTDTGRPRTWKPNILNWPAQLAKPIEAAFARENEGKPMGLRSGVAAPLDDPNDPWVIVDFDLKTAEVVALAYYAGDQAMIGELTGLDTNYAQIDPMDSDKVARLVPADTQPVPKGCVAENDPKIQRHADGAIKHPKRDLHWEMAEEVTGKPREELDSAVERNGIGKVANFSVPYGSMGPNLERMVEANTGKKPAENTGEKMIAAYQAKRPVAWDFLQKMEQIPLTREGTWQSVSGRIRHFKLGPLIDQDYKPYLLNKLANPLGRKSRNYPMQEIVAATTARALVNFVRWKRTAALIGNPVEAHVFMLLYDAMGVLCRRSCLKRVIPRVRSLLTKENAWDMPSGLRFHFDVDMKIGYRWGVKASKEEMIALKPYLPA